MLPSNQPPPNQPAPNSTQPQNSNTVTVTTVAGAASAAATPTAPYVWVRLTIGATEVQMDRATFYRDVLGYAYKGDLTDESGNVVVPESFLAYNPDDYCYVRISQDNPDKKKNFAIFARKDLPAKHPTPHPTGILKRMTRAAATNPADEDSILLQMIDAKSDEVVDVQLDCATAGSPAALMRHSWPEKKFKDFYGFHGLPSEREQLAFRNIDFVEAAVVTPSHVYRIGRLFTAQTTKAGEEIVTSFSTDYWRHRQIEPPVHYKNGTEVPKSLLSPKSCYLTVDDAKGDAYHNISRHVLIKGLIACHPNEMEAGVAKVRVGFMPVTLILDILKNRNLFHTVARLPKSLEELATAGAKLDEETMWNRALQLEKEILELQRNHGADNRQVILDKYFELLAIYAQLKEFHACNFWVRDDKKLKKAVLVYFTGVLKTLFNISQYYENLAEPDYQQAYLYQLALKEIFAALQKDELDGISQSVYQWINELPWNDIDRKEFEMVRIGVACVTDLQQVMESHLDNPVQNAEEILLYWQKLAVHEPNHKNDHNLFLAHWKLGNCLLDKAKTKSMFEWYKQAVMHLDQAVKIAEYLMRVAPDRKFKQPLQHYKDRLAEAQKLRDAFSKAPAKGAATTAAASTTVTTAATGTAATTVVAASDATTTQRQQQAAATLPANTYANAVAAGVGTMLAPPTKPPAASTDATAGTMANTSAAQTDAVASTAVTSTAVTSTQRAMPS